jgi:hypothetical protein
LSFFDLENELPGWLDGEIGKRKSFNEIVNQTVINNLDTTSPNAYHMVCAGKGNMVGNIKGHEIWKFEEPVSNMRTYGKYLEYTSINPHLEFWVGIVVQNKTITPYLWFGKAPPAPVRKNLKLTLVERKDGVKDYWYRKQQSNSGQASGTLRACCGCCSLPLSEEELKQLETEITKVIGELLDSVK